MGISQPRALTLRSCPLVALTPASWRTSRGAELPLRTWAEHRQLVYHHGCATGLKGPLLTGRCLVFTQCPVKMQQLGAELSYLHHCDTVEMTGVGSGSDVCSAQIWGQTVMEEKKSGVSVCLWEGGGQGKQRKRALTLFGSSLSCVLSCFSSVWFFVSPWTAARQAPLSMGILQARILEWVTMPFSRGFFLFS